MSWKRYRDGVIVLLALAVPFWFLRTSMKDREEAQLSGPDKLIIRIVTPIQFASAKLAGGVSGFVSDYVYLVDVKEDNTTLAAENARLEAEVSKLQHLQEENRRLRGLLELKNHTNADVVSAEVISKDTAEFFRVTHVSLDRPSREIRSDAHLPVITLDGGRRTRAWVYRYRGPRERARPISDGDYRRARPPGGSGQATKLSPGRIPWR